MCTQVQAFEAASKCVDREDYIAARKIAAELSISNPFGGNLLDTAIIIEEYCVIEQLEAFGRCSWLSQPAYSRLMKNAKDSLSQDRWDRVLERSSLGELPLLAALFSLYTAHDFNFSYYAELLTLKYIAMTQMYCFFAIRTSGHFEIKFLSSKTLTEPQAQQWRDYYAKCCVGDVRIAVFTEHHFPVQA